jgi:hypothetical protein
MEVKLPTFKILSGFQTCYLQHGMVKYKLSFYLLESKSLLNMLHRLARKLEIEHLFLIDWFGGPKPLSPSEYLECVT